MGCARAFFAVIVISFAALLSPVHAAAPPAGFVESFTPTGAAKNVRQASVRFRAPMVALGDPRLPDPFTIACPATGTGRWVDARNWVYDFDADLPAGLTCTFTLSPGLHALDGSAPDAATLRRSFAFSTGGPAIVGSHPYEGWSEVDESQVFVLKLDAAANAQSIREHARCIVEGIGEQIPVEVLEGEARAALLRERASLGYWYYQLLWKTGAESRLRVRDTSIDRAEEKITLVRCQRPLPPGSKLELLWGAGIATTTGIATTNDQRLAFRVRRAFTAQAQCTRVNARAGCLPMLPVTLQFSAPVPRDLAAAVRLKRADGKLLAPRLEEPQAKDGPVPPTVDSISFDPPFAENKAVQLVLPAKFVDDAGRALSNAQRFPLEVRVDAFPPLAKFNGPFGILEAAEGGVLPVTLRGLESKVLTRQVEMPARLLRLDGDPAKIAAWVRRVAEAGEPRGELVPLTEAQKAARAKGTQDEEEEGDGEGTWREDTGNRSVFGAGETPREVTLPKPGNSRATQVIGIPLKKPGFYVVEVESRILGRSLLGRDESRYVATSALVTDLAVHFKWGRESSLAWVTRLSTGAPVAGADVLVSEWCTGTERWHGTTDKDGVARIPRSLGEPNSSTGCGFKEELPLMVVARAGEDLSFAQTGWAQGIEPWDFKLPHEWDAAASRYHTVLDRTLFRAGETVSMKHFLRRHTVQGLEVPRDAAGQREFHVRHRGSGQDYVVRVRIGADGIGESEWKIPAEARLGDYVITMADAGRGEHEMARFKVEQFRLPSMRATVSGSATPLVRPKSADVDLYVAYLSGGGAAGLTAKLRTLVQPAPVRFADYDDYVFSGKPVEEGVFAEGDQAIDFTRDLDGADATTAARIVPVTLDASGSARVAVPDLPDVEEPARLVAELEYADANGELLTSSGTVALLPARLNVGIRRESWAGSTKQLRFRVVALDLAGKPAAGRAVKVSLYGQRRFSFRKRLVGGFYAYETTRETRRLAPACDGTTDARGLVTCEVAPGFSGEILIRAEAADVDGRVAGATTSAWVYDSDDAWFGGTDGDRMDVLPEQKAYEAGDVARFQVRMPFRQATALVTTEREGVIDGFVTRLEAKQPVVQVPVTGQYAPNVFVSVLAVRGRVAHADVPEGARPVARRDEITGLVDLNKPAFRLGIAGIKVGWKPHRLDVRVTSDRSVYRVRDRAKVRVHVSRADGGALPAGTEVALAAVDAALLGLAPNPTWDVLAPMMGERGLDVLSSTAQLQVVGKRHYGRKAVPTGGGGGRDAARELFDTLLLWRGRVRVDGNGDAAVDVPLNDSLTEFRIVAVASGGANFYGTGALSVTSTQDVILLSGLPPLVREGDDYLATVTVRNTTSAPLSLELSGTRTSLGNEGGPLGQALPLAPQRVELAAGQGRDVSWRVSAPAGAAQLRYEVRARASGGATDTLRVTEQVIAPYPVRTYQATLLQLDSPASLPLQRPADALPGRGGVEVTLRAKLGDGLDGVREWMRLYPYTCIEQLASTALVAQSASQWDAAMSRLPAYLDRDGLVRYFPVETIPGDDSLTAYLLAVSAEARLTIPAGTRQRMVEALKAFVAGRIVRQSALPTADLAIRKLAAIGALARVGEATPAMVSSLPIEPRLWPTSAVIDWVDVLKRVKGIPNADGRLKEALQVLRTRLNLQGTMMTFSTERTDGLWWLMISADVNANRLLLAVQDLPEWREDVPRLVRGALGRQQRGHWNTTVANAWGVVAMRAFSARFESVPVAGNTRVTYGATSRTVDWARDASQRETALPWQDGPGALAVAHEGAGKPWLMVRATAAMPLTRAISSGYQIRRTVTPVEQKAPGRWTRGDVARVRLELTAQTDMSWVVVEDPIPGGSSILGSGLGGQSQLLQRGEQRSGAVWPAFEERRFDGFRAYFRFVPKGSWTVEYTVRLNNPGTFVQSPTRVEAMYAPEVYGEAPNARVVVER